MKFFEASLEQSSIIACPKKGFEKGLAVSAGAGAGKTTTLVAKCVKLIEQNPFARFVAVSFTERSAEDLKIKLSESLLDLLSPDQFHQQWIMTIHGLCAAILREFPKEADLEGEESVLSESESQGLWTQALDTLWFNVLPIDVEKSFKALLERESRTSLESLLRRVLELSPSGILKALNLQSQKKPQPLSLTPGTSEPMSGRGQKQEASSYVSSDLATGSLYHVAHYVLDRYDRLKKRLGVLDFQDLEKKAYEALCHFHVRETYTKRFNLILVDEFQDTSFLQAQIIRHFARKDFSNLCVVGDEKQSIYRFRDADVSLFQEFCLDLPLKKSLTWNFRSRPPVIEFVNQVCGPLFESSSMVFEPLVAKRSDTTLSVNLPGVIRLSTEDPRLLGEWIQREVKRGVALQDMALLLRKIRGNESWIQALQASGVPLAIGSGGLFWEDPRVRELVSFLKWWDCQKNTLSGAIFLRSPWVGISDALLDEWITQGHTLKEAFLNSDHPLAQVLKPYQNHPVRPGELLMVLLNEPKVEEQIASSVLGLWHRVEQSSAEGKGFHEIVQGLSQNLIHTVRTKDVPPPRSLGQLTVLTLHGAKGLEFPHVILVDFGKKQRASDAPLLFWDRKIGAFLAPREDGERTPSHPTEAKWREWERAKELAESKRLFYVALTRAQERLILVFLDLPKEKENLAEDLNQKNKKPTKAKKEKNLDLLLTLQTALQTDDWRSWVECSSYPLSEIRLLDEPTKAPETNPHSLKTPPHLEDDRPQQRADPTKAPALKHEKLLKRLRHSVTEWTLLNRCPRAYEWTYIHPPSFYDPCLSNAFSLEHFISEEDSFESPSKLDPPLTTSVSFNTERTDALWKDLQMKRATLGTEAHACLEKGDEKNFLDLEQKVGPSLFKAETVLQWMHSSSLMKASTLETGRQVWKELAFEVPIEGEILVGCMDRVILQKGIHTTGTRYETSSQAVETRRYTLIDFKVSEKTKSPRTLEEAYWVQMLLYKHALLILDPLTSVNDIQTMIVHISPSHVQEVPIEIKSHLSFISALVKKSQNIIRYGKAEPKPSFYCQFCSFKKKCEEGVDFLEKTKEG